MVSLPPTAPDLFTNSHPLSDSPPRVSPSRSSTLTGIVLDRDWSGRTFNIPDCPTKDTVGSLKEWYIRNVCPTASASMLKIVRHDNGSVVSDDLLLWQLAEGESVFSVAVLHVASQSGEKDVTLYVQHESTGISTAVTLPPKSTLLQLKLATFEQLSLGDAMAALNPSVRFSINGILLDNEATIHAAQLSNGDRVLLSERCAVARCSPSSSRRSSPNGEKQHSLIADIWAASSDSSYNSQSDDEEFTLPPSLLREESDSYHQPRCCKSQRKSSQSRHREMDLARTKSTYRTKMCRVGAEHCKYGHTCWFAHTAEELRKPSDPLPAHCPGVSKLEKYTRRQECN